MHHDHPIQQLVRRRDTRFQVGFVKEAREASHRTIYSNGVHDDV